jgi:pyruvate dehydrogenase E1 component
MKRIITGSDILGRLLARHRSRRISRRTSTRFPEADTSSRPIPGNRELERRIKSIIRWNAMAMVTSAANKNHRRLRRSHQTFASRATLYEVGFNHFFRGRGEDGYDGDQVYFQGHASPGMYARAFLEGRLSEENLEHFRRELQPEGGACRAIRTRG